MNLYLIRHGRSQANENWTILKTVKDEDIELTDKGIEQAHEAGTKLKAMKIDNPIFIVSTFLRAQQTYDEIVKVLGTDPRTIHTSLIKEHERNLTDPNNWDKIKDIRENQRDYDKFKDVKFEGGETLKHVLERAKEFLSVLEEAKLKNVIVVSHGQFIKMLLSLIDDEDPNDAPHLHNCEIVERVI